MRSLIVLLVACSVVQTGACGVLQQRVTVRVAADVSTCMDVPPFFERKVKNGRKETQVVGSDTDVSLSSKGNQAARADAPSNQEEDSSAEVNSLESCPRGSAAGPGGSRDGDGLP